MTRSIWPWGELFRGFAFSAGLLFLTMVGLALMHGGDHVGHDRAIALLVLAVAVGFGYLMGSSSGLPVIRSSLFTLVPAVTAAVLALTVAPPKHDVGNPTLVVSSGQTSRFDVVTGDIVVDPPSYTVHFGSADAGVPNIKWAAYADTPACNRTPGDGGIDPQCTIDVASQPAGPTRYLPPVSSRLREMSDGF